MSAEDKFNIVLAIGNTGSGKSTMLSALVLNQLILNLLIIRLNCLIIYRDIIYLLKRIIIKWVLDLYTIQDTFFFRLLRLKFVHTIICTRLILKLSPIDQNSRLALLFWILSINGGVKLFSNFFLIFIRIKLALGFLNFIILLIFLLILYWFRLTFSGTFCLKTIWS